MNKIFSKAPLVELIAELRWGQQPVTFPHGNQTGLLMTMNNSSKLDEFFMRFGGEVYQRGFQRAERVVPSGFPMVLNQPVFRYRKSVETDSSVFYQIGPGLFSANAIPPYRSWDEFGPEVQSGIESLLRTREENEKELPFTYVSLRYIDAFRPELTEGRDIGTFIKDVLGITIVLPDSVSSLVADSQKVKPLLQFAVPLANNMNMNIGIGEGMVSNEFAIIMDTTVSTATEIAANAQSTMQTLNTARSIIHELFFALTAPIQHLMQPIDLQSEKKGS